MEMGKNTMHTIFSRSNGQENALGPKAHKAAAVETLQRAHSHRAHNRAEGLS